MKNILKKTTSILIALILCFYAVNEISASSFRRRKKKVPKSDKFYGKNWTRMDEDLDRSIEGRRPRGRTQYRRRRTRNNRQR